ncbi:GNAT family N-acetyltransferase [Diaminobutyricimonas sp. LJ205]|uniref:GNAT family N-acetyltransferase n=1 Tax=Diaminobutyricimonas sp. LJ205 TaxID=2683590 RepID=UPI0012F4CBC1|nr:GNAT family N-acetyltransferase [Diaminobutyricimonas sp. LJ205]
MKPFVLATDRLRLDFPVVADAKRVFEYCQDREIQRFTTVPVPYQWKDAVSFVGIYVPDGWSSDHAYTWALREREGSPLMGVISLRHQSEQGVADVGFWIGAPHRGQGYMTEALRLVSEWALGGDAHTVKWECFIGNIGSATVAQHAGFRFVGVGPSEIAARDGGHPPAWHAELTNEPGEELPWPI